MSSEQTMMLFNVESKARNAILAAITQKKGLEQRSASAQNAIPMFEGLSRHPFSQIFELFGMLTLLGPGKNIDLSAFSCKSMSSYPIN